jgi:cell filamentation protein, protein adenylyltransferase
MGSTRKLEDTHPWIDFKIDLSNMPAKFWMLLGEARSKVKHMCRVDLSPTSREELHKMALVKSVRATTAIEGNTLSEDEVRAQLEGVGKLPPSREYLGDEVDNMIKASNIVLDHARGKEDLPLSLETICRFNFMVLDGLAPEDGVIPGEVRKNSVVVGDVYRGAPAEDCDELVRALCKKVPEIEAAVEAQYGRIAGGVIGAVFAHLYIAWIHPFGNGNGRTARLIELLILMDAGVPSIAAHLMSNHYNLTRQMYYQRLKDASLALDPNSFYLYALEGFVDGLGEQLDVIHFENLIIAWKAYIHEVLPDDSGEVNDRRRHLIVDMQREGVRVPLKPTLKDLVRVSGRVALSYNNKSQKTLDRDIDALKETDLLESDGESLGANVGVMQGFMAIRKG